MLSDKKVEETSESRTRKGCQELKPLTNQSRGCKTIYVPLNGPEYFKLVDEPLNCRTYVDEIYENTLSYFPKP